jgi:hypothetical protein
LRSSRAKSRDPVRTLAASHVILSASEGPHNLAGRHTSWSE